MLKFSEDYVVDCDTHPAIRFARQGYSVIPLRGKSPALQSWRPFQQKPPTEQKLAHWFTQEEHTSFGIICGTLSRIIVLDFDDLAEYQRFTALFPDLLNTLIVRSGGRGGRHLYYTVDYPVPSQRLIGGDLIAEGKYVVGPGSEIEGKRWEIVSETTMPRPLHLSELHPILEAFAMGQTALAQESTWQPPATSPSAYQDAYRRWVARTKQRNNSLFVIGSRLRMNGHTFEEAVSTLASVHARELPQMGQAQEGYDVRYREAVATLRSVYQQPLSTVWQRFGDEGGVSRLPNTIREKLLPMNGGVATLRFLEGLTLVGKRSGERVYVEEACRLLTGLVGRHSIVTAFEFLAAFPPHSPPTEVENILSFEQAKALVKEQQKPVLLGGKNRWIHVPTVEQFCAWMEVSPSPGDPITLEDVKSAKAYRAALHHHLIQRRPGTYSRSWQAKRLGTTPRTLRTYTRELEHHVLPRYSIQVITWNTLDHVLCRDEYDEDLRVEGRFLEDEQGKRYPAYREVAAKLLKEGRRITYRQQLPNYYWSGDIPPFYQGAYPLPDDPQERQQYLTEYLYALENGRKLPVPRAYRDESLRNTPLPTPLPEPEQPLRPTLPPVIEAKPRPAAVVLPPVLPPPAALTAQPVLPGFVPKLTPKQTKYLKPLSDPQDEQTADILHMTFRQIRLSTARWIVVCLGKGETMKLMRRVQALAKLGKISDTKKYLMKCVQQKLHTEEEAKPRAYRKPFEDHKWEATAQHLHREIPTLRIENSRRLVELYGTQAVSQTLYHMERLSNGSVPYQIQNPAGFFISNVRNTWRRLNQSGGVGWEIQPAPRFKGEPQRKRRKKYDPLKAFLKLARSGKQINWSYLRWREAFFHAEGLEDPFREIIQAWAYEAGRLL